MVILLGIDPGIGEVLAGNTMIFNSSGVTPFTIPSLQSSVVIVDSRYCIDGGVVWVGEFFGVSGSLQF